MSVKRLSDNTWQAGIYLGGGKGKRIRRRFPSEREALDFCAVTRADFKRQPFLFLPATTMAEVAEGWRLYQVRRKLTPARIQRGRKCFEFLGRLFPLDQAARAMTSEDLGAFIDQRISEDLVRLQTARIDAKQLKAAFARAVKIRMPGLDDWRIPEIPEDFNGVDPRRTRVIDWEEEIRLLAAARKLNFRNLIDLYIVAVQTAMRVGEVFGLEWSDVQRQNTKLSPYGELLVRATKTGDRFSGTTDNRTAPITTRINEILEIRRLEYLATDPGERSEKIFPEFFEHQPLMIKVCAAAEPKIVYGRDVDKGLVFHDTRHTAVTRMLQSGVDAATVMAISGHRQIGTAMRYGHATAQSRYRAMRALEGRPIDDDEVI